MADEGEARGRGISESDRCGKECNPCSSESKKVDDASFNKISDSSTFERVQKRVNVECASMEGSKNRSEVEFDVPGEE